MGNSEVGHLNIGAGRVYYQTLPRINAGIDDGSFYERRFLGAIEHMQKHDSTLHLLPRESGQCSLERGASVRF